MRFNKHFEVDGQHAFLGASKHHWINYDLDKMERIWDNKFAAERGTRRHALAAFCIREKVKLQDNGTTLSLFVNDAIGFRMTPEQPFVYSPNCFGTADAAVFSNDVFRVHDLKTGEHPGKMEQNFVYCAYFCLEYKINPYNIQMLCRIYQYDDFVEVEADPKEIKRIMLKTKKFDRRIEEMKEVML